MLSGSKLNYHTFLAGSSPSSLVCQRLGRRVALTQLIKTGVPCFHVGELPKALRERKRDRVERESKRHHQHLPLLSLSALRSAAAAPRDRPPGGNGDPKDGSPAEPSGPTGSRGVRVDLHRWTGTVREHHVTTRHGPHGITTAQSSPRGTGDPLTVPHRHPRIAPSPTPRSPSLRHKPGTEALGGSVLDGAAPERTGNGWPLSRRSRRGRNRSPSSARLRVCPAGLPPASHLDGD
ncbi:hypothetical protein SKAU_G00134910 [Synaphobranchus kaupii]|uniref:Uncharacterized protein n=1 Tax=Synaphobranchus kaupii TaxID=118154 RepID=A0A9Q1FR40_SYNKA|nr:hypothetical protein SKAU_G00134910 [Synaphobranchus kaupii]